MSSAKQSVKLSANRKRAPSMSSVISSSQLGTYTSSHDGSTLSDSTNREDFKNPTIENLESMLARTEIMQRENQLILEYARFKDRELFPQGTSIDQNIRSHGRHRGRKIPQLPTNKKLDMANFVLEHYETQLKELDKHSSKEIAKYRARITQVGIRERELDKEIAQFRREIVEEGRDERSGKIIGEHVLKWYDTLIKSKDVTIGKLRLKSDSLKSQTKRIYSRLMQKLELGEKLQQVDYDQLQINNEGHQEEIRNLSQTLASLQKTSSSVVAKLNEERTNLAEEERQCKAMQQSIETKHRAISKYQRDAQVVVEDQTRLKASNEDIATKKSEYRVPDVSDYIEKKAKLYELSKVIKNWERKVQLAEMNVKRLKKDLEELETPR